MNKLQIAILTLVFLFSNYQSTAQTWNNIGNNSFSDGEAFSQRIAMINDVPYVAYQDRAYSDKATVMTFNGESWQAVGSKGFTADKARSIDFKADNQTLYIAFSDLSLGSKASVMTYNGATWSYLGGGGFTPSIADVVSLDVENGTPWVAFQDAMQGSRISVMKYEGGTWNLVGEAGFSTGFMTNVIHLQVENGIPYVAYRDYDADFKASVMKFENNSWQLIGQEGFSIGTYDSYHGLAVRNGIPYVAGWGTAGSLTVYRYEGSNWATVGDANISVGAANYSDLRFSSTGDLYVFYKDVGIQNKSILKKFNGSEWEQVGEPVTQGDATFNSLALYESSDGSIIPHVAYRDDNSMRRTSAKKFDVNTQIEMLEDNLLNIFPNPTSANLFIDFKGDLSKQNTFEIRNISGQLVKTEKDLKDQLSSIDISDLHSGLYLLRLTIGEKTYNRKFLVP
ncbi:MAG: T9SS type A sorting domain-containing protein [Bacteroidia bacterium]